MGTLAIGWTVLARGGSALGLGATVLLTALPAIALGPSAGALVDRLDARRVVLATQIAKASVMVLLGLVVQAGGPVVALQGLALTLGLIGVLDGPALARFGAAIVAPAQQSACLAFGSVVNATGRIAGMALGGLLAATLGSAALLWADAASFATVIVAVATLRVRAPGQGHQPSNEAPDHGVRAGLALLRRHPTAWTILLLSLALGSVGRNFQVTMAAMADGPLSDTARGGSIYGLLSTAFAVGALIGALLAARLPALRLRILIGAAGALALVQISAALAPGVTAFTAAMACAGGLAVVVDTAVSTHVLLAVSEQVRGRAAALLGTASAIAAGSGALALGWLCDEVGPRHALALAGLITLVSCAAAARQCARAIARGRAAQMASGMTEGRPHIGGGPRVACGVD